MSLLYPAARTPSFHGPPLFPHKLYPTVVNAAVVAMSAVTMKLVIMSCLRTLVFLRTLMNGSR